MKRKDFVLLVISATILVVAGYLGFSQLAPHKTTMAGAGLTIEKVPALSSDYNQGLLQKLTDPNQLRDFSPTIDLTTGLNNPSPFGPF